jgi:Ion channel
MSPTMTTTATHHIAVLVPLTVGMIAVLSTIMIHALALRAAVHFVRRESRLGHAGASFVQDVAIVAVVIGLAFTAHLVAIAGWAALFMMCGEFSEFAAAFDHSAVNYTTLGYGDVVMTPSWRLLGPLEAANGMLMFGVSTGMIFAVIHRMIRGRFADFGN